MACHVHATHAYWHLACSLAALVGTAALGALVTAIEVSRVKHEKV